MQYAKAIASQQPSLNAFPHIFHRHMRKVTTAICLLFLATASGLAQFDDDADDAFLPSPARSVTTVPTNGDINPYGVAFVPDDFQTGGGPLHPGDILVSNFNAVSNLQGTGTTIVRIPKSGSPSPAPLFFQSKTPAGLSTALGLLRRGFVIVGNFPSTDGTFGNASPGSLIVINNHGAAIQNLTGPEIQGPWDMALVDYGNRAIAFVTNGFTGTVSRIDLSVSSSGVSVTSSKTIASGYIHRGDPVTFVVAPTGLVYDQQDDVLYVASTGDNAVFAISHASTRTQDAGVGHIVYQDNVHLHGPLGMAEAPNGHLLVSNNDGINSDPNQPSEIVEFTKGGEFVKQLSVDPAQGGAFGLAVRLLPDVAFFAAVDDNASNITIWQLNVPDFH